MRFKFFPHTADAKFQAYGKNLNEAFANAAVAMFSIMTDCSKIKPEIRKNVNVEAADLKALLYNFLEELVFLMDTEDFLLSRVDIIKISRKAANKASAERYALAAAFTGDRAEGYETQSLVKAITYSEMEITEKKGHCAVQAVVDI